MRNNTFFTGQPLFTQLLQLIPNHLIRTLTQKYNSDHYYKKFKTYDHIVSMLYCDLFKCNSLRELCTGMQACHYKLYHLGLKNTPRRSTIAEANSKRPELLFSDLYHHLYAHYYKSLPDTFNTAKVEDRLFIMDSTTISLFTDIMKRGNKQNNNGRQKGGAKAHVLIKAQEDVPRIIHLTHAAKDDRQILPLINIPAGSILVFDKGYNKYQQFQLWTAKHITWVTRLPQTARIEEVSCALLDEHQKQAGVLADVTANVGNRPVITVRIVKYYDAVTKKYFAFATNNFQLQPSTIAGIYKKRWRIELIFKRIKQHHPLHYFLGDNENAIKIQVWCAFIADLLIKIIKDKIKSRNWSFANIAGMIRQHLMTYIHIIKFLSNPDKALLNYFPIAETSQLKLVLSG
jgi:hypothetical protein